MVSLLTTYFLLQCERGHPRWPLFRVYASGQTGDAGKPGGDFGPGPTLVVRPLNRAGVPGIYRTVVNSQAMRVEVVVEPVGEPVTTVLEWPARQV